jgi:hypothetical protein
MTAPLDEAASGADIRRIALDDIDNRELPAGPYTGSLAFLKLPTGS